MTPLAASMLVDAVTVFIVVGAPVYAVTVLVLFAIEMMKGKPQ